MGAKLIQISEQIRAEKGPFFIARLALRLKFSPSDPNIVDSKEREEQLLETCRALGYEIKLNP